MTNKVGLQISVVAWQDPVHVRPQWQQFFIMVGSSMKWQLVVPVISDAKQAECNYKKKYYTPMILLL